MKGKKVVGKIEKTRLKWTKMVNLLKKTCYVKK